MPTTPTTMNATEVDNIPKRRFPAPKTRAKKGSNFELRTASNEKATSATLPTLPTTALLTKTQRPTQQIAGSNNLHARNP